MSDLTNELKNIIDETMIPATHAYIEELQELDQLTEDEQSTLSDMEGFLDELHYIKDAIDRSELSEEQMKLVYEKIINMLEEHED